jgi:hypothetical protein
MPTHYNDPTLTCDTCGVTRPRPRTRGVTQEEYRAEREEFNTSGWTMKANPHERPLRLLPHTSIVSCPGCPPVV